MKILQKGDEILNKKAKEITLDDIQDAEIKSTISEMKNILQNTKDAVALAAPQIGKSIRLFLISKRIFGKESGDEDLIFVNPKIVKTSKDKIWEEEGCLSVKGVYGEVERFKKATVQAYDENGKKFTFGASGLLAQIFQHEVDHLNGILFTEKARNLRKDE